MSEHPEAELDPVDALEQRRSITDDELTEFDQLPAEADAADAAEQRHDLGDDAGEEEYPGS